MDLDRSRAAGAALNSKTVREGPTAGPTRSAIYLFCDGACSGNPGQMGIGILLRFGRAEKVIAEPIGHGTNNVAELTAIRRGLAQVRRRDLPVVVVTDSSYAIGVVTGAMKARKNLDLVREITSLVARFKDIRFEKVAGHAGHPENEEVDGLASRAAVEGFRTDELREAGRPADADDA